VKLNPTLMKCILRLGALALLFRVLVLSSVLCPLTSAFAQGSLTPPGAPAPTMKSLDQIEARTPISSLPFTISSSGSYYLTKNLSVSSGNAITVNANGVTLDLNGFTISSTAASANGTGILINSGLRNIAITNGFVQGSVTESGGSYSGGGFANGINYTTTAPQNVRVSGVSVSGCLADGINLNATSTTVAESCTVHTVGGFGIAALTVKASVAADCGLAAIIALNVTDSYGGSVNQQGINATTTQNCIGESSGSVTGPGINTAVAQNCYGSSQSNYGINAASIANSCAGLSSSISFAAINAGAIAFACHGTNSAGGPAITTCIAIGCASSGGVVNASCSKWLGTP
jgi:hypothetical protein